MRLTVGVFGPENFLGTVDGVQVLRLVEHRRLLRVEVLGFTAAEHPPAESHGPARHVPYGEHHAFVEPVPELAAIRAQPQVRGHDLVIREALLA